MNNPGSSVILSEAKNPRSIFYGHLGEILRFAKNHARPAMAEFWEGRPCFAEHASPKMKGSPRAGFAGSRRRPAVPRF
jgi:hypothetical protein